MSRRDLRRLRKVKERQERLRQERHRRWYGDQGSLENQLVLQRPIEEEANSFPRNVEFLISRAPLLATERMFRESGMSIQTTDEEEEAQELAFRALEATDASKAVKLAERALQLDEDCVDALAIRGRLAAVSLEERISMLRRAVEAGRRFLGDKFFRDNRGHFWAITETRPYMRARRDLAEALVAAGQVEEGMSHLEEMLKLNCNDNQGVRDILFGLYLECGKLEAARELFRRYSESVSAVFLWSRALERFLVGKQEEALIAVRVAHACNRFVKDFLTGAEEKPLAPPESYSPGKQSEALYAVWCIGRAWEKNSQAAIWLEKAVW